MPVCHCAALRLSQSNPETGITIEAPEGVSALRVAMNAEDDGARKNQFEFSAFRGKEPRGSENACKDNGTGQFAFCAIDKPRSGPWTIALKRLKGEGEVQITTLFVRR